MRRFLSTFLVATLIVLPAIAASPPRRPGMRLPRQEAGDGSDPDDANGDTDDDAHADGNVWDLGNGTGIPLAQHANNSQCVPFYAVRDAILGGIFGGRCGNLSRAAVRLAFHDAGTFSLRLEALGEPNGGADGSMLWDPDEVLRDENNGLQDITSVLSPLPAKFNVSHGDVLHLAAVLGVLSCPGGPRIEAWVGRPLPKNVNPTGMLPSPFDSVPDILARVADMGFAPTDLIALLGAHGTARQRFVDPTLAGEAMDSTIDLWDVNFYNDTFVADAPDGVFRLPSDVNFAHNESTTAEFFEYIDNQPDWDQDYRAAHLVMSTLGQSMADLINCTELMPASINLTQVSDFDPFVASLEKINATRLEAAIQFYRAPWLVPINLQKFTGALDGLAVPMVWQNGTQFFITGSSDTFSKEGDALSRACTTQHNTCANAANAAHNQGGFTVGACDVQQNQCFVTNGLPALLVTDPSSS